MAELTTQDLDTLRRQLDARERLLRGEVAALDAERDEADTSPTRDVQDAGDQGEARIREAVRGVEQDRDLEELQAIAQARDRMAAGTYGECIDCGSDIPLARLKAQPTALRDVACQARWEEKWAGTHPSVPRVPLPPG